MFHQNKWKDKHYSNNKGQSYKHGMKFIVEKITHWWI
jgi:hypothetical protein